MGFEVFISFARPSGWAPALALRQALKDLGLSAFVDQEDRALGHPWDPQLQAAQQAAKLTLVVVTPESLESPHQNTEVQRAVTWWKRPAESHLVVPWATPSAPPPDRWPSGLATFPAVVGDVREVARQLFLLLHPQTSTAGRPTDEALAHAAAWLDRQLPTIASRRQALRGRSSLDPALTWGELLPRLDLDTICRLIEALEEPGGVDVVDNLRRSVDAPVWAPANLKPEIDAAYADLKAERYDVAEARLRRLLDTTHPDPAVCHRLRAQLLNALTGQGKADEALDLIAQIDPAQLNDGDRERLARRLLLWERWDEAAAAAPRSQVIAQLIGILRDKALPESLVPDPEVLLHAGALHLEGGRLNAAATAAQEAWATGRLTRDGKAAVTALMLGSLLDHAWGTGVEAIVAPATALKALNTWCAEAGPWPQFDAPRTALEQFLIGAGVMQSAEAAPASGSGAHTPADELTSAMSLGLDALLDLAERRPTACLVQLALAQALLQLGRPAEALTYAQRAHASLPGRGQKLQLAAALGALDRRAEAEALLTEVSPRPEEWWRLHAALANTPAEALRRAQGWCEAAPTSPAAWVQRCEAALRTAAVPEARQAAHRALELEGGLSIEALKVMAHAAAHPPASSDLRRAVMARLEALRNEHPAAEALRMWVLLGEPGTPTLPIDWAAVEASGAAVRVDMETMLTHLQAKRSVRALAERAWQEGVLCHAGWARVTDVGVGLSGVAFTHGDLVIPTAVPPGDGAAPPAGARYLVDLLGLELIAALDLCAEVDAHISALVIFEDVYEATLNAVPLTHLENIEAERAATRRVWAPAEALPLSPLAPTLMDQDAPALRAWMRARGRMTHGRPGEKAWSPPPTGVVLGTTVLYALGGDAELFIRTCIENSVTIAISEEERQHRLERDRTLGLREEAGHLAERLFQWLGRLQRADRLQRIARPAPPNESVPQALDPAWGWAWSHRGVIDQDADLRLVTVDLAEWGVLGWPMSQALPQSIAPAARRALNGWIQERVVPANTRVSTLPALIRAVCPADRWPVVADKLAAACFADAWGPTELAARVIGPNPMDAHELERSLRRWLHGLDKANRGLAAQALAHKVGQNALGPGLLAVWENCRSAATVPDPEPMHRLLHAIDAVDRINLGRSGLLEHALFSLLTATVEADGRRLRLQPSTEPRMRACQDLAVALRRWAATTPRARAALEAALGRLTVHMPEHGGAEAILPVLYTATPAAAAGIDLSGPPWARLIRRTDGQEILDGLTAQGQTLAFWLTHALQSHPWQIDGLAVIAEVRPSDSAAPVEVRLPLSATLDQQGPAELNVVAALVRAQDAAVAGALRAHAAAPTPETQAALRTALDRSPVPWLRLHPLSILRWTLFSEASAPWPRTLEELRGLLGEPTPWISAPDARLQAVIDAEVAAPSFDLRPLVGQLTAMPGVYLGLTARAAPQTPEGLALASLEHFSRMLEDHEHHAVGMLAEAIFALSRAGAQTRVQRLGEREVTLPRLAAELAAAALAPEERPPRRVSPTGAEVGAAEATRPVDAPALVPQTYAQLESGLLRAADAVIGQLGGSDRVSDAERTHLGWRLCAWWSAQAERTADPAGALRALAATAAAPVGPPSAELFDPRRFGPGAVDLRELILVQVLYVVAVGADRGDYALDWDRALPALHRIASRAPSPAERALRAASTTCTFGSPLLCAPDLALATLMKLDRGILELAEPLVRLRWLDGSLDANDAPAHLWALRDETLLALTLRPALRSPAERRLLEEQLGGAQALRPARRRALLRLSGVCPGLAGPALEVLRQALRSGETTAAAEALGDALFARAGTDDAVTLLDAVLDEVRAAALSDAQLRAALVPLALGRGRGQVAALAARLWPGAPAPTVDALLHSPAQGAED